MRRLVLCAMMLCLPASLALAQTGKITGQVTDAASGEPMPGVNVVIEGTTQGTTTDTEGYYTIINVRPGTYDVRASFIGFTPVVQENVRVNIDLTAEVNFEMQEEAVGLDEVVVSADQEVVQRDLSASRVDISADQIENLPVTDINRVVGLQAGVQGLNIRGSGADQAAFIMDGFNLGTRRDNTPYTNISYAGVDQIQIQSGGFTAKYGDMRSGIVNVVTKEGQRDRYTVNLTASYGPPTEKYFGMAPNAPNSYWMRPYTDPQVAFEGTEAGWDEETQNQFPFFQGYNSLATNLASDEDPNNDLTPEQIQALFLWEHRRDLTASDPDYVIDGGFGGPVPGISQYLGDLRFFATYRRAEDQYIIPLTADGREQSNFNLKLTSNIAEGMKLVLDGMWANEFGASTQDRGGTTRIIGSENNVQDGTGSTFRYDRTGDQGHELFGTGARSISDIDTKMFGAAFTHTLSPTTFYEVRFQRTQENYLTRPPAARDETCLAQLSDPELNSILQPVLDDYCVDEAPFGWKYEGNTSFVNNMRMGGHWAEFRDTTEIVQYAGRFDFTSQVNRTNLVQAGVEFSVTPQDVNFGFVDQLINPDDIYSSWNETELYGAIYVQDKLEFRGMIANLGLRLDYMNPNTEWYVIDEPYSDAFLGKSIDQFDELIPQEKVDAQVRLSPRLGVSFPVTDASKLYFNYGHAYQRPKPQELYRLSRAYTNDGVWHIANPWNPMQLTIQYEAGYEQSFLNQFLVRIAGYYKNIKNQPRQVSFISRDGLVDYSMPVADSYADTRGIEISVFRNAGKWVRGFLNYSYMVDTGGAFGFPSFRENRVEQRRYEESTTDYYQDKPLARPYARFNIEFLVPPDFGPDVAGLKVLGDWRLSFLGEWKKGEYFTFTGGQTDVRGIQNNMYWKGYKNVDLRISKNLNIAQGDLQLYADIRNVFNLKNFNASAFSDGQDFNSYINSLHLPEEMVEGWEEYYAPQDENGNPIYGDDVPGTLDKDYINEPNITSFTHLFPRRVFFGMRLSI